MIWFIAVFRWFIDIFYLLDVKVWMRVSSNIEAWVNNKTTKHAACSNASVDDQGLRGERVTTKQTLDSGEISTIVRFLGKDPLAKKTERGCSDESKNPYGGYGCLR